MAASTALPPDASTAAPASAASRLPALTTARPEPGRSDKRRHRPADTRISHTGTLRQTPPPPCRHPHPDAQTTATASTSMSISGFLRRATNTDDRAGRGSGKCLTHCSLRGPVGVPSLR